MRIRVIGREDPLLFTGLAFALLVIFQQSIQRGLEAAGDVERTYGLSLRPALLILTVMFVFHQFAKRREMKAEALTAATETALARARAAELEQLMLFGQSLSRALTTDALRETIWRHLPAIAGGDGVWVVLRQDEAWDRMMDTSCSNWPAGTLERIADHVAMRPVEEQRSREGIEHDEHICFAMRLGDSVGGVVGLSTGSANPPARHAVGAAATLLAIAIRNAQLFANIRDHSVKDALTGCYNREHGLEVLDAELTRSSRSGQPVSVILFDVDNFKSINDRFGHLRGDFVLSAVGQRMRGVLRRSDVRCRYGGDEFMVILPETGESGAARVGEWLRGEIEQMTFTSGSDTINVTVSIGVVTTQTGNVQVEDIIGRADQALYEAKAHGRNCVRTSSDASLPRPVVPIVLSPAPAQTH